ncbi:MAG: patatin-like phospholipase family protein [Planctomycetaceae bacterium]
MTDTAATQPRDGIALCLSGGGYRAMLFHVGVLIRLNEFGILKKLKRVSSVSGGSITAAVLGMNWKKLAFNPGGVAGNLPELLIQPIQKMAGTTIDASAIVGGVLWRGTVAEWVSAKYADLLFGNATLQDLPDDTEGPRFVLNATNVQSGALFRMSRPFVGDYRIGRIPHMKLPLATAVAASSAFPPFLSPMTLDVNPADFRPDKDCDLSRRPFTDTVVLSDGGVYDNLGLETAMKFHTLLVSDAGGKIAPEEEPASNWAEHSKRILDIVDDQVRNLRKRILMDAFQATGAAKRAGTYWSIRSDIRDFNLPDALPCDLARTTELANTPTRLKKMPETLQERLMNWGYAVADAGIRRHAPELSGTSPAARLPCSNAGI